MDFPFILHDYTFQRRTGLAHVEKKDETNKNYYVHYIHEDKRMDEWVPAETCSAVQGSSLERKKRKRSDPSSSSPVRANSPDHETSGAFPSSEPTEPHTEDPTMTLIEDEYDLAQHKKITAARNFDDVYFGEWRIQTWFVFAESLLGNSTDIPIGTIPRIH